MIEVHSHASLVLDTDLAASRRILVGRRLLLPQVVGVKTILVADGGEVHDEVGRGAFGGLRGGGGRCGGVGGRRAVGSVGLSGSFGGVGEV